MTDSFQHEPKMKYPAPPPVAGTLQELDLARRVKHTFTLNDLVEIYYRRLVGNPEFKRLNLAVYDEQAVHGSCSVDNVFLAKMIIDAAKDDENEDFEGLKIATVIKALGVVLRRYGQDRKSRRNMLGGMVVDPTNGDNE